MRLRRAGWLVSPVIEARVPVAGDSLRLIGIDPLTAPAGIDDGLELWLDAGAITGLNRATGSDRISTFKMREIRDDEVVRRRKEDKVKYTVAILLSLTPYFFPVVMQLLGLLTGMIQAYIFAILAMVYIASATGAQRGPPSATTSNDT